MKPLLSPVHRALPIVRSPLLRTHFFHSAHALLAARKVVQTFRLADIGEGITECEVIKWSVKPPSSVRSFDALCEVQSDKASVEITSPFDGIVKELLVQEGEIAKVGAGLCLIEVEEEGEEGADASAQASPDANQDPTVSVGESAGASSSAQGEVGSEGEREGRTGDKHPLDPTNAGWTSASDHALATPSVRHFARQHGIDITSIAPGSGRDGRVEKTDVEAFIARGCAVSGAEAESTGQAARAEDKDVVVELGRTRYGMWKAMTQSLDIPTFGYSTSLDLTRFHGLLPLLNANIPTHYLPSSVILARSRPPQVVNPSALYPMPAPPPVPEGATFSKLTYLPFLLKTLASAMMEWPLLRASITSTSASETTPTITNAGGSGSKPTLTIRPTADISLALSTPTGLYTPTLIGAQSHSVYLLASRVARLAHLGRQVPCGLTPREMPKRGGTVGVSNVGAVGDGTGAKPVLVPGGGVAIVAVGRARWVWDVSEGVWERAGTGDGREGQGRGERRLKVDVSWSADHRVVEGAELAAFVETWRGWVENPERLIGEGV